MRQYLVAAGIAVSVIAMPAFAQKQPAGAGGAVVATAPGKAAAARAVKVTALVTAIDQSTRTVTLKGPQGRVFDIVAGDEVKNLAQIQVGDHVVVEYIQAIALQVAKGDGIRSSAESGGAARAQAGQKPGVAAGRQVTIMADVIAVDKKAMTVTLKGPKGNVVELAVENPDQFNHVKQGDQVRVDYVEAAALSVQPTRKK